MDPDHRSSFRARSYELDSYRHLNNAVYVSWFEQARLEFLRSHGFSYDGFADRGEWMVVVRTEVDFRAAVQEGDALEISTRATELGRSSVRFLQIMRRGPDEIVCEARTVMAFTGEQGSIPIPEDVRAALGPLADD
ncbi:MAG: acyl-CoA thioesterase [Planctomycetota bacterium]|jgi:acyl-CoA thioester hydrolase